MIEKSYRWRAIAFSAVGVAFWYVFASVRTQGYGTQWGELLSLSLVFLLFLLLYALPVLIVLKWRPPIQHILLGTFALMVFSIGGAEAFARAQEWMLIDQFGEHPNRDFVIPRWPPFQNSCIGYTSSIGWWGCD